MLSMMLLTHANVDDVQLLPILSVSNAKQVVNANQSAYSIVAQIEYEPVAFGCCWRNICPFTFNSLPFDSVHIAVH